MAGFAQTLDPRILARLPKSFRPLYEQAYGETLLRHAPQQQSLLAALGQAEGGYQQKVAQANAAADLIGNAALTQQRSLPAAYQAPGNPLMGLLGQRGVQAAEGAKYQIAGYQGQRDTDLGKIDQALGDLGTNAATYFSTRADQLVQSDRKTRHDTNLANKRITADLKRASLSAETSRRGQDITVRGQDLSHEDRQAAIDARRDAKKKGPKLNTPGQHGAFKDKVNDAISELRPFKKAGKDRHTAAKTVAEGLPGYTQKDPKTGKTVVDSSGQPVTIPGVKKLGSGLLTSIALDLVYDGHVSARNVKELHKRGYSLKRLGLPTGRGPSVTGSAVGSAGKGKGGF